MVKRCGVKSKWAELLHHGFTFHANAFRLGIPGLMAKPKVCAKFTIVK